MVLNSHSQNRQTAVVLIARAPPSPSSIHRRRRVTPSPRVTLPHLCAIKQHQRHRRARQPLARRSGQCVPADGHDGVRRRRPRVLVRVSRPRLVPLVSRRVLVRTLAVLDARIARARAITAGTRATARRRWLSVSARTRPGTSEMGAGEARSDYKARPMKSVRGYLSCTPSHMTHIASAHRR